MDRGAVSISGFVFPLGACQHDGRDGGRDMGGWDSDKSGDYVPSPPPIWLWVIICLVCAGLFALAIMG